MEQAIDSAINGQMGMKTASKTFNVPRSTLQRLARKAKASNLPSGSIIENTKLVRNTVLGSVAENKLVDYILKMEAQFYGLTKEDLRRMVYAMAIRNKIKHRCKNGIASRSWLNAFLNRH